MQMRALLNKYVAILRIELEDLEQDINDLITLSEKRRDSREITNYVYLANRGLLENEIHCIKELLDEIATIDAYQYQSAEELIADVTRIIEERIRDGAFPAVVHNLVKGKLDKVRRYVMKSD